MAMLMEGEIIDFNQDSFLLCDVDLPRVRKKKTKGDKENKNGEVLVGMVIL